MTTTSTRDPIDGERKYRVITGDDGMSTIVALLRRSQWGTVRKAELYTMRAVHGATLHDQSLGGMLPTVGHRFPTALLKADGRTGRVMSAHLATISDTRKAERAALKTIKALRAAIL